MVSSSLCDKCFAPGACCKRLFLSSEGEPLWLLVDNPQGSFDEWNQGVLPFVVNELVDYWPENSQYASYNFNCPKLDSDGRCSDYENRPELCRRYEPQSDELCVHFEGAEGTGEGL